MNVVLDVRNLKVYYELGNGVVKAVDNVSFQLYKGEVLGIAGESGSGKSTLGQAIAGLIRPPGRIVGGQIFFKGKNLLEFSESEWRKIRGKEIGVIFQDPNSYLNPVYAVGFQVAEAVEAHNGGSPKHYIHKAIELLKMVRIADAPRRAVNYPFQLSGGMKQRVLTSIAIANKPELIIADEPTSALDVTVQAEVVELLLELKKELGSSMIFITHDLPLLLEIADRIMVMYAGKIVELGSSHHIKNNPLHPYTRGLLESVRYERKAKLKSIPGSIPSLISPPPGCRFAPRCPFAYEKCRKIEPPLKQVDGRLVACHLFNEGGNDG
uniref:Nickel import system ATP-binding protein NikD n=1 Tax=Fervidicoccus fontis TaxID=683846 RepID=A0A7C1E1T5_9CREN